MWAIADSIPSEALNGKGKTSIKRGDLFRTVEPETLLSLRFENNVLSGIAKAVEQTKLGTLEDAYMCIIPPLSRAKKLRTEAVVEFVRQQVLGHEMLRHWKEVLAVYVKLFRIFKLLGPDHPDFRKTVAVLIDAFLSISDTLMLRESQRRGDGLQELKKLKEEISCEVYPITKDKRDDSLGDLMSNFGKLLKRQKRPNLDQLKDLVSKDASGDLDKFFQQKNEPLSAIITMQASGVKDILSEKIGVTDIFGWTLLHYAAIRLDKEVVEELLKKGANPKAKDLAERTPLHYAIDAANPNDETDKRLKAVVSVLIEYGADTELRGRDGIGALHCAARNSSAAVTNQLLEAGAYVNIQDNARRTPLHWAAYKGSVEVIKILLRKGADKGARDDYGRIPLHLAAVAGEAGAMKELLDPANVEKDSRDRDDRTPLHLAAIQGHGEAFKLLVGGKADKGVVDQFNCKPQDLIAVYGHEHLVSEGHNQNDSSTIILGICFGRTKMVKQLVGTANGPLLKMLLGIARGMYV